MQPPEQARRWQQKIDEAFPHGVIMTADDESDGRSASFGVPRPEVVAMRGIDPVVFVEIPDHHRNFSGTVTGWDLVQEHPCTVVKVTMDMGQAGQGRDEAMRWSGNVSPANQAAMREWRTMSLLASDQDKLYRGPGWFREEA